MHFPLTRALRRVTRTITLALAALALAASTANATTAVLSAFAAPTGGVAGTGGHAWLLVKNVSSSAITVGNKRLAPNVSMSLGTWGNLADGKGLYYNVELYVHQREKNRAFAGRVSLNTNLTGAEVSTLSSKVRALDSWSYTNNCSSFVQNAWNAVSPSNKRLSAGGSVDTPGKLANSITGYSSYIVSSFLPAVSGPAQVFRNTPTGVKNVSQKTLNGSSGSSA